MKQQTVVIKSNKYGITLFLDKKLPFEELLKDIGEKFHTSEKFFRGAKMVLGIEGREVTQEEQLQIIETIQKNSSVEILCILDNDDFRESYMRQALEAKIKERDTSDGKFYKGTLRSGQVLESESSIIILGDVNPGAKVISKGNVVVLGALKGTVYAGAAGNECAFVASLNMGPVQIRIADFIACSSDEMKPSKNNITGPMIAYTEDGNIYMEPITKEVINDIRL